MLLSVSNVACSFGVEQVIQNATLLLNAGDRVGLVGANGVGKTTLLRVIAGEVTPTAGQIVIPVGVEIGYLPQTTPDLGDATVAEMIAAAHGPVAELGARLAELERAMSHLTGSELEAALDEYGRLVERFESLGGYDLDARIDAVVQGLGLAAVHRDRPVETLSGGEKARVALAALLLRSPDLLLLDEPSNHLDAGALEWLESYLPGHRGAILLVSHDRALLNRVATAIVEIAEHSRETKLYTGNYDAYVAAKRQERERWEAAYAAQQEEIRELRYAIRVKARQVGHFRAIRDRNKLAYNQHGEYVQRAISSNVRAAEERLRRIEADPIPRPPRPLRINPDFDPATLRGKQPLVAESISLAFGPRRILDDLSFVIEADSRIVITGPNGAGKSTLLKVLAGLLEPDAGRVLHTPTARIGYLDQEQESLPRGASLFAVYREGLDGAEADLVADLLRYGLFAYADLSKPVEQLSVGQRRKLQLARLIAVRANVLLLDEPTNHLQLDVLEAFEQALADFPGPVVAVSHDRRFVERFAGEVWELHAGRLTGDRSGRRAASLWARVSSPRSKVQRPPSSARGSSPAPRPPAMPHPPNP